MKNDNQTEIKYQQWFEEARQHDAYHIERAKLQLAALILDRMEELGMNQSQLAKRIGVSRQSICKILNGHSNLTIARIVKIARALDSEPDITFNCSVRSLKYWKTREKTLSADSVVQKEETSHSVIRQQSPQDETENGSIPTAA